MKPKQKQYVRTVTALIDADPTYLSLVPAGANGSPFNHVKQEKPRMATKIKKRTIPVAAPQKPAQAAVRKNANKRVTNGRKALAPQVAQTEDVRVIAKFIYDSEVFADEAAVRDHLEKSDFEGDYTIEQVDKTFVVTNSDVDATSIKKSAEVEADPGVIAVVAILKGDDDEDDAEDGTETTTKADEDEDGDEDGDEEEDADEDDEEEDEPETTTKTEEKPVTVSKRAAFIKAVKDAAPKAVAKFDGWDAFWSKKSTLSEALVAGMSWDSTPPGFYDVQSAFNGVVSTLLSADDMTPADKATGLQKAAADYADLLIGMDNFFDAFIGTDAAVVSKSFEEGSEAPQKIAKWAEDYAGFIAGTPVKETKAEEPAKKVAKTEEPKTDEIVAKAIASALAPLTNQLETVSKAVEQIGSRRQVSKGTATADGTTPEAKPSDTKKKAADPAAVDAANRLAKTVFAAR